MTSRRIKNQPTDTNSRTASVSTIPAKAKETTKPTHAKRLISPDFAAFQVIQSLYLKPEHKDVVGIVDLTNALLEQAAEVNRNNLSHVEAMLINQATALQALFARLSERSMRSNEIPNFEANMRMALRAQSQCRATLETLAAVKNPPVIFARQANIAQTQQVNNGRSLAESAPSRSPTRGEKTIQPNELLTEGIRHGTTLDSARTGATVCVDQELGAVE